MNTPTLDDIKAAADRIKSYAVKTPLLEWPILNDLCQGRIFAKIETFQRTGSFKFRGAYNRISQVRREDYPGGIVACSSGNHAQGVAEAARLCGLAATIVMPKDAPNIKIEGTKEAGGSIIFYDRATEDRDAIARRICEDAQGLYVPPFDDKHIMAGQGTTGLEMAQQARAAGVELDAVLIPTSGGGLTAGIALAIHDAFPKATIHTVEPNGFDDYKRSLETGTRQKNARTGGSICDALLIGEPGVLTFEVNKHLLSPGVTVSDDQVRDAIRFAYKKLKLILEPGGAIALAALLSGTFNANGRNVAIILSGGNIDSDQFADIIQSQK